MSEIIPPPAPDQEPPKPVPPKLYYKGEPPSKKACAAWGCLLFIVSSGLAFVFPPICLVGLILAITSLFMEGYRCIFVGYILIIGLLLLAAIIYCAVYPVRFD